VIKTILSEGQGWQNPKDADEVVITYTARLKPALTPEEEAAAAAGRKPQTAAELGLPVVASSPEGGAVFELCQAPCSGFAAALKSMKQRESALLLLKPECEYRTCVHESWFFALHVYPVYFWGVRAWTQLHSVQTGQMWRAAQAGAASLYSCGGWHAAAFLRHRTCCCCTANHCHFPLHAIRCHIFTPQMLLVWLMCLAASCWRWSSPWLNLIM
jgi:hypothetical protein